MVLFSDAGRDARVGRLIARRHGGILRAEVLFFGTLVAHKVNLELRERAGTTDATNRDGAGRKGTQRDSGSCSGCSIVTRLGERLGVGIGIRTGILIGARIRVVLRDLLERVDGVGAISLASTLMSRESHEHDCRSGGLVVAGGIHIAREVFIGNGRQIAKRRRAVALVRRLSEAQL